MLYGMLWPELASKAAAIITVSNHAKSRLLERLKISESKVSVVRNGVSQKFRPADAEGVHLMRQRLGIPPGPYILSVCSNEPRKNLSTLLTAWASIASKHVGVTLVLSGALGNKNVFRSQQVNALPDNTIVTGYVEEELLPALYSGASCFVYPSLYEGFGLPVLEAHACGVPVVTSDQTSLKEIAGPAHLIDPRSPADIASTILKVMDAGQTTENSKIARSHASKFTWDQCASETESLLLSIAS
jgi:glycosyltransferase involved in cell wall biosynthesis